MERSKKSSPVRSGYVTCISQLAFISKLPLWYVSDSFFRLVMELRFAPFVLVAFGVPVALLHSMELREGSACTG